MKKEALEDMREVWVKAYMNTSRATEKEAQNAFDVEREYFQTITEGTEKLAAATDISLRNTFLNIAANGLSIQPGSKAEAYVMPRTVNINNQWVNVANLQISPYGELKMRIAAGQIVRCSNPIVVYEGDIFQPRTNERGDLYVEYAPAIPRKSNNIIACYVQLVLPHDGRDYKWLTMDDVARLAGYSQKQNRSKKNPDGVANSLYSSNAGQIDTGFLEAKTIKHAMRAYTKLRVGDGVTFDDEEEMGEETPAETVPADTVVVGEKDDEGIF
ncbi:MAG: recombinase RecT [Bacteroides sp.]|nr:recombinase RecT [Bacteroides sp.]MCM1555777.1 recombinase RecT [Bacteroides sp.]